MKDDLKNGSGPPGSGNGAACGPRRGLPNRPTARANAPGAAPSEATPCPVLRERLDSTPEAVRDSLLHIASALDSFGLTDSDRARVEMVLAEILNNIVEHAYDGARDGWISLRIDLVPEAVDCQLEDAGAPMPGMEPPDGRAHDLDVELDDLPEGGFGWYLIRELTQRLRYAHHGGRNQLTFRIATGLHD